MKRVLFFIMTLLLVSLAVSCGDGAVTTAHTPSGTTAHTPSGTTAHTPSGTNAPAVTEISPEMTAVSFPSMTVSEPEAPTAVTPYYELRAVNGKPYLFFTIDMPTVDPNEPIDGWASLIPAPELSFTSLAEMRQSLLTGDLDQNGLDTVNRFPKDSAVGGIPIPNLNDLYEPILPGGFLKKISMIGHSYRFTVELAKTFGGYCYLTTAEDATQMLQDRLVAVFQNPNVTVTKHIRDHTNHCDEIYYQTSPSNTKKALFYTVEKGGNRYTVWEDYILTSSVLPEKANAEVPNSVTVILQMANGRIAWFELSGGSARLDKDEITSLGFQPWQNEK